MAQTRVHTEPLSMVNLGRSLLKGMPGIIDKHRFELAKGSVTTKPVPRQSVWFIEGQWRLRFVVR